MKRSALLVLLPLLLSISTSAQKNTGQVNCVHHFNVLQYDELQNEIIGLTSTQLAWYQKKMEKKYPYACYDPTVNRKSKAPEQGGDSLIFLITVSSSHQTGTQTVESTQQVQTSSSGTVTDSSGNVSSVELQGTASVPLTETVPYTDTSRAFLLGIYFPNDDGHLTRWHMLSRTQVRQRGGNGWAALGTNLRDRHPDHGLIEDALKFLTNGQ